MIIEEPVLEAEGEEGAEGVEGAELLKELLKELPSSC